MKELYKITFAKNYTQLSFLLPSNNESFGTTWFFDNWELNINTFLIVTNPKGIIWNCNHIHFNFLRVCQMQGNFFSDLRLS